MLNQWTGPSVKSTMSQYLRLQFLLLLLQYIIQNLSQLIALAYPFQHITSLHFLKLTLCLTLLCLRISQQFSSPLETTPCSPLFILRKVSWTNALLNKLNRFGKQSHLLTNALQQNLTLMLHCPLNTSLKVLNSTLIS